MKTDNNNIIKLKHVHFQYQKDAAFTLEDVSFNIPKHQWTSIVGHNGSGKSTIAKLIVRIEQATKGEIFYNNHLVTTDYLREVRRHIGIVFQNPENQFVGSIVEYDVAFGLENHAVPHDKMKAIVIQSLDNVDMKEYMEYEPHSLSGGQKQRVAIAGVLALSPDVIILDEATSMLDPQGKQSLLSLIKQVKQEKNLTIISITHDLSEALESDHVVIMNKGKVYKEGKPNFIFLNTQYLVEIGLDLPFAMKMNQKLGFEDEFTTYEGLVDKL